MLPDDRWGELSESVGYFECDAVTLARWVAEGLGHPWRAVPCPWRTEEQLLQALQPRLQVTHYICAPAGQDWSLMLNDAVLGTDVGLFPSYAARELEIQALRAVWGHGIYPARIIEMFGPQGRPPLKALRSIAAANDGGRWVFETSGDVLPFEDTSTYERPRRPDRFPGEALHAFLRAIGIPEVERIDLEASWIVERSLSDADLAG